jgi:hypothetical protein
MTTSEMLSAISKLRRERNVVVSERNDALQALTGWENKWKAAVEMAARAEVERDELIYIAERAIALAEIDFENDKFGVVSELRDGLERIKEGAN